MPALDLASLTADQFEVWRDQAFHLRADGRDIPLTLAEIRRSGQSSRAGGVFALTFLAPLGPFLPQAIYEIAHRELGAQAIFLVPIGPQDGGNAYEAVFG